MGSALLFRRNAEELAASFFFSPPTAGKFCARGQFDSRIRPGERRHLRLAVPSARRRHGLLSNTGLSGREKMVSSKRLKQ